MTAGKGLPSPFVEDSPFVIRTRGLGRSFVSLAETVWAVRDVDLDVRAGELVCLMGASGSGKSTLLNLIGGLDEATAGTAMVGGLDVTAAGEDERSRMRLQEVGVVFQENNLIEEFTAVENVMLPLEASGSSPKAARLEATVALARVGLAGFEGRHPSQLSGGQRQRVGIARALVGPRRVLLADEPTGALDAENTRSLFALLRELCDGGLTVVVATHDPLLRRIADTVYTIEDGRLCCEAAVGAGGVR